MLEVVRSKSFRQSNAAREITYRAKLKNPADDVPLNYLLPHLQALFDTIIEETRKKYGDSGVMRIYISHPSLEKAIIVPPTYLGYLTSELILEHIDNVLYSSGEIPADDSLEINAGVVEFLQGSGRKALVNLDKDIKSKRSFVRIKNDDLPRAIVVGYRHLIAYEQKDRESLNHCNRVRDSRRKVQGLEAEALRKAVGIPSDRPGNIQDISLYENYLKVKIVVLSSRIGNRRVYEGSPLYERTSFIYHFDTGNGGHFDTITKVNGMVCKQYYCSHCDKGFKSRIGHKCKDWCNICGRSKCKALTPKLCKDCNKMCRSYECYKAHKSEKKK